MKQGWVVAAMLFSASVSGAGGLSTPFADVHVDQVPMGKPVNIAGPLGNGLPIKNLGDTPVRVYVQVLQPRPSELKAGAAAIPDVRWIQITPEYVNLPPHGEAACQITLKVPSDRRYRRQHYQATLWSRTKPVEGGGMVINTGLLSKVRFTTR